MYKKFYLDTTKFAGTLAPNVPPGYGPGSTSRFLRSSQKWFKALNEHIQYSNHFMVADRPVSDSDSCSEENLPSVPPTQIKNVLQASYSAKRKPALKVCLLSENCCRFFSTATAKKQRTVDVFCVVVEFIKSCDGFQLNPCKPRVWFVLSCFIFVYISSSWQRQYCIDQANDCRKTCCQINK